MMDEELWELDRLRRYAAELHDLITDAESAAPAGVEATDRSGAVRLRVGRDGRPEAIRVAADWSRRIAPGYVGPAVVDAYRACVRRRTMEWSQTLRSEGFRERVERLERLEQETEGPCTEALPPAFRKGPRHPTRPLDEIADDVISAAESVGAMLARSETNPPAEVRGTGAAEHDNVTVTLSAAGAMSCTVDPAWVITRDGRLRLPEALGTALTAARADLAAATHAAATADGDETPRLDGLVTEILAKLDSPGLSTE